MAGEHSHTVDLFFQAVNVMIPVVTGFLILFMGAVGTLWQMSTAERPLRIAWRWIYATVIFGVLSFGFFAWSMHYGIRFSATNIDSLSVDLSTRMLWKARRCLAVGYQLFILSLGLGALSCRLSIRHRS